MRYSLIATAVTMAVLGLVGCGDLKPPTPYEDAAVDQAVVEADLKVDSGQVADSSVDSIPDDSFVDTITPDLTVDTVSPDALVDSVSPDSTVDSVSPDATVDTIVSDAFVDAITSDSTVDSTADSTADSGVCTGPTLGNWGIDNAATGVIPTDEILFSIDARGPTEIYAAGSAGKIWKRDAFTWFQSGQIPGVAAMSVKSIWVSPTQIFAAGGSLGSGFVARYDGSIWHVQSTVPGFASNLKEMNSIWGASDSEVYAVGTKELLRWNGSSWSLVDKSTSARLGLWGDGVSNLYMGNGTDILRTNTNSLTTLAMAKPYTGSIQAIWGSSGADVLAVTDNNATGPTIIRFNGITWSSAIATSTYEFKGIHGTGANHILAVGAGSVIFHFDGAQWTQYPKAELPNTTAVLYDVWAAANGAVAYAVGSSGAVWGLNRCP
jgi:hypothetical protein